MLTPDDSQLDADAVRIALRDARIRKNVSVRTVARALGVCARHYRALEAGERTMSVVQLVRASNCIGLRIDTLCRLAMPVRRAS